MRTIAPVATIGMVGIVGSQVEEDDREPSQEYGPIFDPARATEFDERKRTFKYLKELRKPKKLG